MTKEIKKLKWKKGDCIAQFTVISLADNSDQLVGGKLKEIIDKINEIITQLNEQ